MSLIRGVKKRQDHHHQVNKTNEKEVLLQTQEQAWAELYKMQPSVNMRRVRAFLTKSKRARIKTAGNLHAYHDTTHAKLKKQYEEFVV